MFRTTSNEPSAAERLAMRREKLTPAAHRGAEAARTYAPVAKEKAAVAAAAAAEAAKTYGPVARERAQAAAEWSKPHVEAALERAQPAVDAAMEKARPHVEHAIEVAAPRVQGAVDSLAPKVEEYSPKEEDKFAAYLFMVIHAVDYSRKDGVFATSATPTPRGTTSSTTGCPSSLPRSPPRSPPPPPRRTRPSTWPTALHRPWRSCGVTRWPSTRSPRAPRARSSWRWGFSQPSERR